MNLIFKKIKFAISKFIYFDFQTLNKQMIAFFRTRPGKILLWQKFSKTWDSDFNCNGISVFELNHFLLMEMHEILIYSTAWSVQKFKFEKVFNYIFSNLSFLFTCSYLYRWSQPLCKFIVWHKLLWMVYGWRIKSSKSFPRRQIVQGLSFKPFGERLQCNFSCGTFLYFFLRKAQSQN